MSLNNKLKGAEKYADKEAEKLNRELIRQYQNSLNKVRNLISYYYEKYETNGVLTYVEMAKYNRYKALNDEITQILIELYKQQGKDITGLLRGIYSESYLRTFYGLESELGQEFKWTMMNEEAIKASIQNPISGLTLDERLERNRNNVIIRIKEQITQGLILGQSYKLMTDRVKDVFDGDAGKSVKIVNTETHRVLNDARLKAGQKASELGIDMIKVWDSTLDTHTRSTHQTLDQKKVGINEDFKSPSGGKGPAPGQLGKASEDINCRCALRYEVDGISPTLRRARDLQSGQSILIESMTYEEWKKHNNL